MDAPTTPAVTYGSKADVDTSMGAGALQAMGNGCDCLPEAPQRHAGVCWALSSGNKNSREFSWFLISHASWLKVRREPTFNRTQ